MKGTKIRHDKCDCLLIQILGSVSITQLCKMTMGMSSLIQMMTQSPLPRPFSLEFPAFPHKKTANGAYASALSVSAHYCPSIDMNRTED